MNTKQVGLESLESQEEMIQLTQEELMAMQYALNSQSATETKNTIISSPIELEEDDKQEIIESKEFKNGIKLARKYIGIYTAFVESGMSIEFANDFILNQQTLEHSLEVSKINARTNKEIVELQQANISKTQI